MSEPPTTIQEFETLVAHAAHESGLMPGRTLVLNDPEIRAFANQRLATLTPAICQRDHFSRWLKSTLEASITAAEAAEATKAKETP